MKQISDITPAPCGILASSFNEQGAGAIHPPSLPVRLIARICRTVQSYIATLLNTALRLIQIPVGGISTGRITRALSAGV